MFTRLLIATVVTTTTLTSVAWQQANVRAKHHLLLFTDLINCPPCRLFDAHYKSDANFRTALNRDYQTHVPYTPQRDADKFAKYGVEKTPTWLIVDNTGNELGRVSGYVSPTDLWERLQLATPANAPSTGAEGDLTGKLRQANRLLEAERDALQSRIRSLEKDIANLRSASQTDSDCEERVAALQAELRAAKSSLADTQKRMHAEAAALREQVRRTAQTAANAQAETQRLQQRLNQESAEPYQTPPKPADDDWLEKELRSAEQLATQRHGVPNISPEILPTDSVSRSWSAVFRSLAVAAVTVAAPQFAIPLSAGLGAAGWLWSRRRKRSQSPPRVVTVDAPPLPQVTQTDTRFVNVEKDTFAKAHAWAQEQLVRRYPGAVPSVETLNSLIQQYLNATKES